MDYITEGLTPSRVFKNFEDISRIPRASGNEKQVSDYIKKFAEDLDLKVFQDSNYNLIIKKAATNGRPDGCTVMLQAHIDMVTESTENSDHDFEKDPIDLIIDGDIITARDTTLGADNGIGVAYIMSILESKDIIHPNLECVLTTSEEFGLIGVNNMDLSSLKSEYVVNLDSEEDYCILTGCAGAVDSTISLKKEYKPANTKNVALEINIHGLLGGHSGMDIDKQRGNANVIMGRLLNSITHDFDLFYVNGGSKRNVIPRSAEAVISVSDKDLEKVVREIQKTAAKAHKEIYSVDPNLKVSLRRSAPADFKVFSNDCKKKIIRLLNLIPDGVISMSNSLEGTVQTSTNFSVVRESNTRIDFINMTRSSMKSEKELLKSKLAMLAEIFNASIEFGAEYEAWEYNPNSKLEKIAIDAYEKKFSKKPEVAVMHCGLESGILLNKLNHKAEAISIGPNIFDVHSPDEYAEISSIGMIWDYLIDLLKTI